MRQIDPPFINSSISPVIPSSGNVAESTPDDKELAEKEEIVKLDDTPVPGDEEEVGQPRLGRRPMAPTKAEIEEHYPTPKLQVMV